MNVTVNGCCRELDEGATLGQLMPHQPGVAIALNGVVVPATRWPVTRLHQGDLVEIVTAHQGG